MKYLNSSITLLLFCLFYLSCIQSPEKERIVQRIDNTLSQSIGFLMDSSINMQSIAGIYQGVFPCNDCEGMEQLLFLKPDSSYKQAYINVDSNTVFSKSKGQWKIEGNRIILSKNLKHQISLSLRNDSLFVMDIDRIPLKNPKRYGLGKQVYSGDRYYWKKEKKKGISFAARGSDPAWILNIKNNIIYFKLQDHKNVVMSEKEKAELTEDNTTYLLNTNNKHWTVTISDHFCTNGLSEDIYEYQVEVNYNGNKYVGCGIDLQNN